MATRISEEAVFSRTDSKVRERFSGREREGRTTTDFISDFFFLGDSMSEPYYLEVGEEGGKRGVLERNFGEIWSIEKRTKRVKRA